MLGVYDYTVILTYLSFLSGVLGIIISLHGPGHPFMGMFFLLFCGLCDMFDGRVARSKKDRTQDEKANGVQIDSLSDLVAFGVLPGAIGFALVHVGENLTDVPNLHIFTEDAVVYPILFFVATLFYALAALIRLAHFNVQEEKRQRENPSVKARFTGLPVTSAALIFPALLIIHYITPLDLTFVYFFVMLAVGVLFLSKFHLAKPGKRGLALLLLLGLAECVLLILFRLNVIG